ncbi:MAG TPA: CopG family transcriptional regulator [Vicinamibacterales bacterium]|nr:CopG family transcriptional regulator [Vicinamibacterales bacterium]
MKRTTIFLDESLERSLGELARRRARPVASLVREALTEYVAKASNTPPRPGFIGAGESGHTDTAERHEELLWQDGDERPAADRKPDTRVPRSRRK